MPLYLCLPQAPQGNSPVGAPLQEAADSSELCFKPCSDGCAGPSMDAALCQLHVHKQGLFNIIQACCCSRRFSMVSTSSSIERTTAPRTLVPTFLPLSSTFSPIQKSLHHGQRLNLCF